jgi:hypothetical protein
LSDADRAYAERISAAISTMQKGTLIQVLTMVNERSSGDVNRFNGLIEGYGTEIKDMTLFYPPYDLSGDDFEKTKRQLLEDAIRRNSQQ